MFCTNKIFSPVQKFLTFAMKKNNISTNLEKGAYQIIDADTPFISLNEVKRFMTDSLVAVGVPKNVAQQQADLLAEADYRGHYSHGMNRLHMYIQEIQSGLCDSQAVPKILNETPATAWVDGQNGIGALIANFCNALAIKKAKEVGIGIVSVKGSNHYGIAGMYGLQALKEGMIGMSFSNTSPLVVPCRAKDAAFGTNPLCVAAPAKNADHVCVDMATSAVAVGKIEIAKRKNKPIPSSWAVNEKGEPETDAGIAFDAGRLLPLGGLEENSGFKGTGLAFIVEILCGGLSGSLYGPNIRKWKSADARVANLGQCFIVIDPKCFAPGFEERISDLAGYVRNMSPTDPSKPVLVPGDPERQHMAVVDELGGLRYVPDQMETCKKLAEQLKIEPIQPLVNQPLYNERLVTGDSGAKSAIPAGPCKCGKQKQ